MTEQVSQSTIDVVQSPTKIKTPRAVLFEAPATKSRSWRSSHPLGPLPRFLFRLLRFLVVDSPIWVWQVFRLWLFVMILLPAFARAFRYYMTSPNIKRNIRYGENGRNFLDVYLPYGPAPSERMPVIVLLNGGCWIIGYKAWGVFVARLLACNGILTVIPDYRNFPQASISAMLQDVSAALSWTSQNAVTFGGDPDRIFLMGQSAGAHLASMTVLQKARESSPDATHEDSSLRATSPDSSASSSPPGSSSTPASSTSVPLVLSVRRRSSFSSDHGDEIENLVPQPRGRWSRWCARATKDGEGNQEDEVVGRARGWDLSQIKGMIGVSGPYNLVLLCEIFHKRGLNRELLGAIMENDLALYSPPLLLHHPEFLSKHALSRMPPHYLFHGAADLAVTPLSTWEYAEALKTKGVPAQVKIYMDKSHTDTILEDLLRIDERAKSGMLADIIALVHTSDKAPPLEIIKQQNIANAHCEEVSAWEKESENIETNLASALSVEWARYVNPF